MPNNPITPVGSTEQLLYSTVRIETEDAGGQVGTGTGFFFNYTLDDKRSIPLIITNKHVVSNTEIGKFRVHLAKQSENESQPSGEFFDITYPEFKNEWFFHSDKNVDLCAMPFRPLIDFVKEKNGHGPFWINVNETFIGSDEELMELDAVEEVIMVGYPQGLWDSVNNYPLFRRGITATHPAVDFEGRSLTLVDVACFPGSSGSPVFLMQSGFQKKKKGGVVIGGSRMYLLGVLSAGPTLNAKGEIVVEDIPNLQKMVSITPMMIHLGFIVKAKEILTLCREFAKSMSDAGKL